VLDLYNVLEDSATLPALERAAGQQGWKYEAERIYHSPYIPLPGDWEAYLAGIDKKQRHEIRRKMRRAEEGEQPVRWYIVEEKEALDGEMEAFFALMKQDPEKERFLTPVMQEQMRTMAHCAFDEGCLQLAFMEVGGEKAAGYFNVDYLNRIWVYNSGIDGRFREYSPGWVLLAYLLRWANENGREVFDFLRGNEDYKYRFGAVDRFVMRAQIQRD
jgi:CelD/BcsL family acetyltransferase involved in cellulose biosynthesis